jgi:hypothetical protein
MMQRTEPVPLEHDSDFPARTEEGPADKTRLLRSLVEYRGATQG